MTEAQIKHTAEIDKRTKAAVTPDMSFAVPRSVVMEILEERDALREALESISAMEPISCCRCEGNGRFWADGKAHYSFEDIETVPCVECNGRGKVPIDPEEAQLIATEVLAKIGASHE